MQRLQYNTDKNVIEYDKNFLKKHNKNKLYVQN